MMDEEKALINAINAGETGRIRMAFERFYKCNARLVYRVLIDTFGKDAETDDDVQESFIVLVQKADRLSEIDHIVDYWIHCAKKICLRRKERQDRISEIDEEPQSQDRPIPKLVQDQELFEKIEKWLGHPDSDIVILHAAYGYTEKEIAQKCHISVDAVSRRYKKSLKYLKGRISDEK